MAHPSSQSLFLQALEATMHDPEPASIVLSDFHRLPPELLPVILGHLRYRQNELARASLVCREWAQVAKPVCFC